MCKSIKRFGIIFFTCLLCFISLNISTATASAFVPDRKYYEKHGDIIWEVPTKQKLIALTFDDGPNVTYTPEVLNVLKKYHAKATFFLIGEHILEHPNLVQKEVDQGHEIENHTYQHIQIKKMSNQAFLEDVNRADRLIRKYQHSPIHLFRPPGGALNKPIIKDLRKEDYEIVLWSWHQDTEDWKRPGAKKIALHVIKNAHNGDIVIMHDSGGNRSQTVKALKIIIPTLQEKGYKFVTVKELMKSCPRYDFLFQKENPLPLTKQQK